jgi:hypothetical protein
MGAIKTKAGGGNRPAFEYNNAESNRNAEAANDQAAADAFVGRALRSLRRVVEFRLEDAGPSKCLRELSRAADAVSSATWALEFDAGLRARGER